MSEIPECREALVAGAFNQECHEPATHNLRGKRLCERHLRQALSAGARAKARGQSWARSIDSHRQG